ncbi:MAG: hypothetical protein R3256_06010 [Thalassovita sp.]|nr:hypothetical protein [Thalassovita sp.]
MAEPLVFLPGMMCDAGLFAPQLADLMPYAEIEIIPGARHLPTLEQPAAVTAILRRWMAQPVVLRA